MVLWSDTVLYHFGMGRFLHDTPRTLDSLRGGSYPAFIWKDAMLEMTDWNG